MANNYAKVLELANKNNMGLSNTIKRDYGIPLDYSSIQESYDAAVIYAATDTLAYVGQPIAVGDKLYIVSDQKSGTHKVGEGEAAVTYDVYLKEVGSKPVGDDESISIAEDGTISLKGFATAADKLLPQVKIVGDKRVLDWVPVSAVTSADGNTITEVKVAENSALKVTKTRDEKTDTYTYTLDVTLPAPPEYSVAKTVNEDGSVTYKLTKDGTAVGDAIVIPKAYDDSTLSGKVSALESTVGGHTTAINEIKEHVDAFFGAVEDPDTVINTLAEIQSVISGDGEATAGMLADINTAKTAIATLTGDANTEGSVDKKIADAVSAHATTAANTYATQGALAEVKSTADAAASKTYVDEELGKKADATALANYALAADTYSKETIDNKIAELVGENFDPDLTVSNLKESLDNHVEEANGKFAAIETAQGTQNNNIQANADAIAAINNPTTGIRAQAVADATTAAQGLVDTLANGTVATHTQDIADLKTNYAAVAGDVTNLTSTINGENGLSNKVGALETAKTSMESRIGVVEGSVGTLNTSVGNNTAAINTLNTDVGDLKSTVANHTEKFKDYSTTTEVEQKIEDAIKAVDHTALSDAIAANATAIANEKKRAEEEETRIAGLVGTNTSDITTLKGQVTSINATLLAALENNSEGLDSIKELAVWVEQHGKDAAAMTKSISDNAEAIAKLTGDADTDGSVQQIVNTAIANIAVATTAKAGVVKASDHVSVGNDGTMQINMNLFTTDAIQQGSKTLVLNGGSAS